MTEIVPAHEQIKNGKALFFVKNYWFMIVTLVALSIGYAEIKAVGLANTATNEKQEVTINLTQDDIYDIKLQYAEDYTWIRTTLEQMIKEKDHIQSTLYYPTPLTNPI